jgi:glycerol-3-phosphate dehydrogenase
MQEPRLSVLPRIENTTWDLVIIGGGITGAGVFREASRLDLKVLLVEQKDFASGASSRSSKLVHGGLRYLKQANLALTRESVVERERLLREAPGLVEPLGFLMPIYDDKGPGKVAMTAALSLYSLLSGRKQHEYFKKADFLKILPSINPQNLKGGFRFYDAQTDDVRLVMRTLREAMIENPESLALNYICAREIGRNASGDVNSVTLEDSETGARTTIKVSAVVNATGSWAEHLHPSPEKGLHLRPLRGSHMIFPAELFPINEAVSIIHPRDSRPVFILPWEGAVLLGTTDVDHKQELFDEPFISAQEVNYLMEGLRSVFPDTKLTAQDCVSTFAGVRPVLSKGKADPSSESRDHVLWVDKGLVTTTGGKLTTFRSVAVETLKIAIEFLPADEIRGGAVFANSADFEISAHGLSDSQFLRLRGRYGRDTKELLEMAGKDDLTEIPGTAYLWAELPYAAKNEQIRHLGDLLLRRVRIGLLTPNGGDEFLPRVQKLCQGVLDWDAPKWEQEIADYKAFWKMAHGLPEGVNP